MLILTRNPGQTIVINENVTIHFLGVRGKQMRVGIEAPRQMPVHRKEVQDMIDAERAQACHLIIKTGLEL